MSEVITEGNLWDELGTRNKQKQAEIIRSLGLNPCIRPDGSIAMTWTALRWARETGKRITQPPLEVLRRSLYKYIFTAQHIIEEAQDYPSGDFDFCGLYFLVLNNDLRYIGISNHVARRLWQHSKDESKDFNRVFAFEAPEQFLARIEELYIWWLDPPDNVRRDPPAYRLKKELLFIQGNSL